MKNITFNEYVRMIEKWKNNNDFREINIQNEVVKPFIEALGDEFDVIDVSIKGRESKNHDYLAYCGTYESGGKKKATTPDLIITKNWNWRNRENKVKYYCSVEVIFTSKKSKTERSISRHKHIFHIRAKTVSKQL